MAAKKVMVTKVKNDCCIVVTDDGEFKKIPLPGKPVQVGQLIEYTEARRKNWIRPFMAAASFFIVFFGLYVYQHINQAEALSYMTLDINPSVEMGLNDNGQVVKATPLNEDGKNLLKGVSTKGREYDQLVGELVSKAAQEGYIQSSEENVIVASFYDQNHSDLEPQKADKIRRVIDKSLKSKHLKADVLVYRVDKKTWQEAKKSKLSAGKVAFSKAMKAKGITISNNELSKNSIKKLIKAKGRELLRGEQAVVCGEVYKETGSPVYAKKGQNKSTQSIGLDKAANKNSKPQKELPQKTESEKNNQDSEKTKPDKEEQGSKETKLPPAKAQTKTEKSSKGPTTKDPKEKSTTKVSNSNLDKTKKNTDNKKGSTSKKYD